MSRFYENPLAAIYDELKVIRAILQMAFPEKKAEPEVPEAVKVMLDPSVCPHCWEAKMDLSTMQQVVYCKLCGWDYSRTCLAGLKAGKQ